MKLNDAHPDYPEFRRRWDELVQAEIDEASEAEKEELESLPCQDGPADAIYKKYNIKRSALQKEFKHLYE